MIYVSYSIIFIAFILWLVLFLNLLNETSQLRTTRLIHDAVWSYEWNKINVDDIVAALSEYYRSTNE